VPGESRGIGGGAWSDEAPFGIRITASTAFDSKWYVGEVNEGAEATSVTAFGLCGAVA